MLHLITFAETVLQVRIEVGLHSRCLKVLHFFLFVSAGTSFADKEG